MADNNSNIGSGEAIEKLMKTGFDRLSQADQRASKNGDKEKTVKLFDFVEVPEMVATVAEGLWNDASSDIAKWLQHNSYKPLLKAGQFAGLHGTPLKQTVGAVSSLLAAGIPSLPYITPVKSAFHRRHEAKKTLAKKLEPVLQDLKGQHGVTTLGKVKEEDNEIIYYARERVKRTAGVEISNSITKLFVNVLPNVLLELPGHKKLWQGEPPKGIIQKDTKGWASRIINIGVAPTVGNIITHGNERKLKQQISTPYSAADMITELAVQIENNPKASSFQLPGRGSSAVSLEKYIEQICLMHQRNMMELNPDHVEIRDALKEDLTAVIKPLSKAIREGKISTLSLIKMIGSGQVIKAHGRAIASPEDVEAVIDKEAEHTVTHLHGDVKAYYKEKNFTAEQNKKAYQTLEGVERDFFVAMQPDEVLRGIGLSDDEIGKRRKAAAKTYEQLLAEEIIGLHAQPESELAKTISQSEIRQLKEAYGKVEKGGVEAVHELRASPCNAKGIENTVLNALVGSVVKDPDYQGKIRQKGHEQFSELMAEGDEGKAPGKERGTKHANKHARSNDSDDEIERDDDDFEEQEAHTKFQKREHNRAKSHERHAERDY